jgi:hypothetical protein
MPTITPVARARDIKIALLVLPGNADDFVSMGYILSSSGFDAFPAIV